jgi:Uma2 family endonuclease
MVDALPLTRERALGLADDGRLYERIDGELLVSAVPQPEHQRVVRALDRLLDAHCLTHRVGDVFNLPCGLALEPGQLTIPDLFVLPPGASFRRWEDAPRPLLVVEVVAPSTARVDRLTKRRLYQRVGIAEYWIADMDARMIGRWRPADERPEQLERWITWAPISDAPALNIDLTELFANALDR